MKIYVQAKPKFVGSIKVTVLNQGEDRNHIEYERTKYQWRDVNGGKEAELNMNMPVVIHSPNYCGENVLFKITVQRADYKS